MKKSIVKVIALSLVAVMMCALLVSCGAPNANPDKAEKALKDNGYVVVRIDNEGLGALGLAVFTAAGIDGIETAITATNDEGESVTIFYFGESADANDVWEAVQEYSDGEKDDESDWVIKKSGKMIYFGTKAGAKAAN